MNNDKINRFITDVGDHHKTPVKYQRLSGAASKRFKYLLYKGHNFEEARMLAMRKMPQKEKDSAVYPTQWNREPEMAQLPFNMSDHRMVEIEPTVKESAFEHPFTPTSDDLPSTLKVSTHCELRNSLGHSLSQKQFKSLSGSGKKRLKKFLMQGYNYDEAHMLAQKGGPLRGEETTKKKEYPFNPLTDTLVKATSDKNLVQSNNNSNTFEVIPQSSAFMQKDEGIGIAIVPSNFPDSVFTTSQLTMIRDSILEKISQELEIAPQFNNMKDCDGLLLLTCANNDTAEWLKRTTSNLKPWDSADLKAIEKSCMPSGEIITAFFPKSLSYSNKTILQFLRKQNTGLNTEEWKILKRTNVEEVVVLVIDVDFMSTIELKKCNYKVCYIFDYLILKPNIVYPTGLNTQCQWEIATVPEIEDCKKYNCSEMQQNNWGTEDIKENHELNSTQIWIKNPKHCRSANKFALCETVSAQVNECLPGPSWK